MDDRPASTGNQPQAERSPTVVFAMRSGFSLTAHDCRIDKKHRLWNRFSIGDEGKASRKMEGLMPGDPKECRQHALNCVHLAKGASTPEQRDHFAKLARTWIKLAEELEQTEVFLAAFEDDEPAKQVG